MGCEDLFERSFIGLYNKGVIYEHQIQTPFILRVYENGKVLLKGNNSLCFQQIHFVLGIWVEELM